MSCAKAGRPVPIRVRRKAGGESQRRDEARRPPADGRIQVGKAARLLLGFVRIPAAAKGKGAPCKSNQARKAPAIRLRCGRPVGHNRPRLMPPTSRITAPSCVICRLLSLLVRPLCWPAVRHDLDSLVPSMPDLGLGDSSAQPCQAAKTTGLAVSDEPFAAQAGAAILTQGGSAADAVTAMFFTLTATYPVAAGLGGGGICLVRDSEGPGREFDFLPAPRTAAAPLPCRARWPVSMICRKPIGALALAARCRGAAKPMPPPAFPSAMCWRSAWRRRKT